MAVPLEGFRGVDTGRHSNFSWRNHVQEQNGAYEGIDHDGGDLGFCAEYAEEDDIPASEVPSAPAANDGWVQH